MSQRSAIMLSTVSLLLRRSPASRRFRHEGLRLTPPVTTSFALLHRNFSSSASSDDEGKKEKHKKATSSLSSSSPPSAVSQGDKQQQKTDVKVVWEYPNDSRIPKKSYQHLEVAHRPGDKLARRVARFRTNKEHKKMLDNYEEQKILIEQSIAQEKEKLNMKLAKHHQKSEADLKKINAAAASASAKPAETKKQTNKKTLRKPSWSIFNWLKRK